MSEFKATPAAPRHGFAAGHRRCPSAGTSNIPRRTPLAVDVARHAVQAFGGLGFAREFSADSPPGPVEAIYRDSKIGEIYEGTDEIHKWITARNTFGKELTG
ncbi:MULTISPECIES: acyl-CoA dehydrogenase family protein [unclassified Streptomyces]|uniref:acyl-CoA dehydrogenase family protein n=1 Tax=unclassified Streptomyces TaxID=2593676 RepID=UPI002E2B7C5C|nr:acyl-CoA dehydrogenase family protein [Streptomyces sp. NBC_00269]